MKHHILIDDTSKAGKGLMQIVEELLSKSSKGIAIIDEDSEDEAFGNMMNNVKTGKTVSRETIMKKLRS